MTRIDEIRERLDKARPGLGEIDGGEELQKRRGNPKGSYTWTLYGTYADAILLVNARNDLAWCLGEIERLEGLLAQAWLEGAECAWTEGVVRSAPASMKERLALPWAPLSVRMKNPYSDDPSRVVTNDTKEN